MQRTVGHALVIGQNGDIYLTGSTSDTTLPTTPGAPQETCPLEPNGSCLSGFVARINPKKLRPVESCLCNLSGCARWPGQWQKHCCRSSWRRVRLANSTVDVEHVAKFGSGKVPPYEYDNGAWSCKRSSQQACESFIAKLSGRDGHELRAATLLGGAAGAAIAVDAALNAYVVGTAVNTFATTANVAQRTFGGGITDGFVTKLNASGNGLLFSTFLGGSGEDLATDVALNNSGMPFITGPTRSKNFPLGPRRVSHHRSFLSNWLRQCAERQWWPLLFVVSGRKRVGRPRFALRSIRHGTRTSRATQPIRNSRQQRMLSSGISSVTRTRSLPRSSSRETCAPRSQPAPVLSRANGVVTLSRPCHQLWSRWQQQRSSQERNP